MIAASEMLFEPPGLIAAVNGSLEKFVRRCNLSHALVLVRNYDVTAKLLQVFENTSLESSSWYIVVQLLTDLLQFDYVKRFEGTDETAALKTCLYSTNDALSPIWSLLMRALTPGAFPHRTVDPVTRLFRNIKGSLVNKNSFLMAMLNDSTSARVQETLDAISCVSSQDLVEHVENITFRNPQPIAPGVDFLNAHITVRMQARRLSEFNPPSFLLDVSSGFEFETKPCYVREHSSFVVPFALKAPHIFYRRGYSKVLNYGTIGAIMARELAKIVAPGATFNYSETLSSPEATNRYVSRMSCYVDFDGRSGSWTSTASGEFQQELFLWLTSVRVAYDALMADSTAVRDEGTEPKSAQRDFFLRFCLMTCESSSTTSLTARQKCLWPLFGMPEFSEAFNCSKGSYMASHRRCYGST